MVANIFLIIGNILVIAFFISQIKKKYGLLSLLPIGVNLFILLTGVVPALYIVLSSHLSYTILSGYIDLKAGMPHYQLMLFVFIVLYNTIIVFNKKKIIYGFNIRYSYQIADFIISLLIFSVGIIVLTNVLFDFAFLSYVGHGMYNKLVMSTVVLGAILGVSDIKVFSVKIFVLLGLLSFFLIGNSRGLALFPIIAYFIGYFFMHSDNHKKKRKILFIAVAGVFILFMVSNLARTVGGYSSGLNDLDDKLTLYQDVDINLSKPMLDDAILRVFNRPSYVVLSQIGVNNSYKQFDVINFFSDLLNKIINSNFSGEYVNRLMASDYGFRVNDNTSVGISMIGYIYQYAGVLSLVIFTIFLGSIHRIVLNFSSAGGEVWKIVSVGVLFYSFFYGMGYGFIEQISTLIESFIYIIILVHGFKIFFMNNKQVEQ